MKIRYEYSTNYNFRPGELYGMGKESLRVQSPREGVPIEQFLDQIQKNSSIKHVDHHQIIYGSDIVIEMEDWKPWIGQPMFYITDIKIEIVDG